jgi:hypothetical protein
MQGKKVDYSKAIDECRRLIAELDAEIARMPEFKRGTLWHTDRERSREGLVERLAQLEEWSRQARNEPSEN